MDSTNELIKEIWSLWESMAECGELSIGPKFSQQYKELKARVEQKLNKHGVSGKPKVCPDCQTTNLHHMGHGAWCCAFCGSNSKPLACASGAVATVAEARDFRHCYIRTKIGCHCTDECGYDALMRGISDEGQP